MDNFIYAVEPNLSPEELADVFRRSTINRPVDQLHLMKDMVENAALIVTARCEDKLVGVSRALTDFSYCTYLSDLAVDVQYQRRGIGRELVRRTHLQAGLHTTLILLAAPTARTYYPAIGMTRHESCWIIQRQTPAPPGDSSR